MSGSDDEKGNIRVLSQLRRVAGRNLDGEKPGRDPQQEAERIKKWSAEKPPGTWVKQTSEDWNIADLKPRPWLAPGYLLSESVSIIGGAPSAGKSLVAIAWAVSCALGLPFGRFKPSHPIRVHYYSVEDDEEEFKKRVSAALIYFNRDVKDMEGRLVRVHPEDDPDLFKWGIGDDMRTFELINSPAWEEIEWGIVHYRPQVFVFDPLVEMNSAPENDNAAQRQVIARFRTMARRYKLCPLIVDHARKAGPDVDPGDASRIRGASSKVGAARNVITCSVMTREDARKYGVPEASRDSYCQVIGAKANYSAIGWGEWFEKVEVPLNADEITPGVQPWTPPGDALVDPDTVQVMLHQLGKGWEGEPYAVKMDSFDRSLRQLLTRHGATSKREEAPLIGALEKAGCSRQYFHSERSRKALQGWRSPTGLPKAKWLVATDKEDGTRGWRVDDAPVNSENAPIHDENAPIDDERDSDADLSADLF